MTRITRLLTGAIATTLATTGLIGASTTAAQAKPGNNPTTAMRLCDEGSGYGSPELLAKDSVAGGPDYASLYLVELSGGVGYVHCAVLLKGPETDDRGTEHTDFMTLELDGIAGSHEYRSGFKKFQIGPAYTNRGDPYDVAQGQINIGDQWRTARIELS